MSECDKFKMQISSYLDGEISIHQRHDFDHHLEKCPKCDETVKQIKIIQESIRQMPQIASSPDFEERLHQQIFNSDQKQNFFSLPIQNWKVPAMGSAIVIATVGVFLVLNEPSETNTNQNRSLSPATTRISPNNQFNQVGGSNSASSFESSTILPDSLRRDSMQIDGNKLQQVKGN